MDDESVHLNIRNNEPVMSADRVLELKIIEAKNASVLENRLVSCCGRTVDRRLLLILINFVISVIIISFCIVELVISKTCEDKNSYLSLMTFIIGYWLSNAIN